MAKKKNSYEHYHFITWILVLAGIATFAYLFLKIVNFVIPKDGLVKPPDDIYQTEYSSDKSGYSISYPKDWMTDTSQTTPADIIKSPDGNMNVAVQQLVGDKRLLSRTGIIPVMKEIKDSYAIDKNYTLDTFEDKIWYGLPSLHAVGTFKDKDAVWDFEESAIFFGSEIYNLRANWKNDSDVAVIQSIISSFKLNGYDSRDEEEANEALASVLELSEVRNFQKDVFENNQSKFSISVESSPVDEPQLAQEPYYVIAVAEFFPDHRTTFNRYRVGKNNEKIYRYDAVNDSWDRLEL